MNKKDRRHSGWVTPSTTLKLKRKEIIDNCLEPQIFYDDWNNYRDSFRHWYKDRSKLKKYLIKYHSHIEENCKICTKIRQDNFKIKKLLKIRKAKKLIYKYQVKS